MKSQAKKNNSFPFSTVEKTHLATFLLDRKEFLSEYTLSDKSEKPWRKPGFFDVSFLDERNRKDNNQHDTLKATKLKSIIFSEEPLSASNLSEAT